ncbi:hypothetical protein [Microbacterium marinilacus]|uniref:DUF222 domain-containing protein n=1 Tax=Microbacterium marinilacus TaxID=415209 RepID=A0ABP7BJ45_9MICO|nr:hypothetical protein [Microbacterium marinilacus]MBY0687678.1 hypothetical protein [Microbacterium marinilacus]
MPYRANSKELLLPELTALELTHLHAALARDLNGDVSAVDALERSIAEQVARAVAYPERYRLILGRWESTEVLDGVAHRSPAVMARTVADAQATGTADLVTDLLSCSGVRRNDQPVIAPRTRLHDVSLVRERHREHERDREQDAGATAPTVVSPPVRRLCS